MSQQFENFVSQRIIATAGRQDKGRSVRCLSTQGSMKNIFDPMPIL